MNSCFQFYVQKESIKTTNECKKKGKHNFAIDISKYIQNFKNLKFL